MATVRRSAKDFHAVRVVVQTDQQPRSPVGEQHGVFAVLVTVVRRRHRRPASALVARVIRVPNRNTVCDRDEPNVEPAIPSLNRMDLVASIGAYDAR
jgi:hypothetical protein